MDNPNLKKQTVSSSIMIEGKWYEAEIELNDHYGSLYAMNGGRILNFIMTEDGEPIAQWSKREWIIPIPNMNASAYLAALYFINRYNKMHDPEIERDLNTYEHQC